MKYIKYVMIVGLIFLASLGIGLMGGIPLPEGRKKDAQVFNKELTKPKQITKQQE